MNRTAVIAGATGLVGRNCLETLLADDTFARVVAVGRRSLDVQHPKLVQDVVSFDRLAGHPPCPCDVAFCVLGTTIRAAGSREAFRRVDFEYVRAFAAWTHAGGAQVFVLVSSVGADAGSRNFYLRTKGEAERAVLEVGFRGVHVFRPSFLVGPRREFRLGERIGGPLVRAVSFLMLGGLMKYRPIAVRDVARAMVRAASTPLTGARIYHHPDIFALSRNLGGR